MMAYVTIRLPDDNPRAELLAAKGGVFIPATDLEAAELLKAITALVDHAMEDDAVAPTAKRLLSLLKDAVKACSKGGTA
jgi:hypothetical protein